MYREKRIKQEILGPIKVMDGLFFGDHFSAKVLTGDAGSRVSEQQPDRQDRKFVFALTVEHVGWLRHRVPFVRLERERLARSF